MSNFKVIIEKNTLLDRFWVCIMGHQVNRGFKSYVIYADTYREALKNADIINTTINALNFPNASQIYAHISSLKDMVECHDAMGIEKLEVTEE